MSTRNMVPEVWSAQIDVALRKTLIYGGPAITNRNYEGEISAKGDTVKVTTVGRPTIQDYIPGSTAIVPEPLNTAQRVLQVDQAKYFAFEVEDIDAAQQAMDFMPQATGEAGYGMADIVDQYIAGLHTQIPAGNALPSVTVDISSPASWVAEASKAYDDVLVPISVRLDEMNVPEEGRYCVLPPWFYGLLRRDPRFIDYYRSDNAAALRTGEVGNAAGLSIFRSNNVPQPTTDNFVLTAGTNKAITFASQVTKIEGYRPESSFSDAIKGLEVYGAKIIRPDTIVKVTAVRT